jgi:hypothetical protein
MGAFVGPSTSAGTISPLRQSVQEMKNGIKNKNFGALEREIKIKILLIQINRKFFTFNLHIFPHFSSMKNKKGKSNSRFPNFDLVQLLTCF